MNALCFVIGLLLGSIVTYRWSIVAYRWREAIASEAAIQHGYRVVDYDDGDYIGRGQIIVETGGTSNLRTEAPAMQPSEPRIDRGESVNGWEQVAGPKRHDSVPILARDI